MVKRSLGAPSERWKTDRRPPSRFDSTSANPQTGKPWRDGRTLNGRAWRRAGIDGLWFHDLRRSFVTNARRRGIPESAVMRMSGHRTRAAFDRYNIISETDLVEALGRLEAGQQAELADS
jgi:integrase